MVWQPRSGLEASGAAGSERAASESAKSLAATENVITLAAALHVPEMIAGLLLSRGIKTADEGRRFLHPSLDQLHDPMKMLGMRAAVERLERAIAQREALLIYGDYDVDGTMATVILKTVVELLGGVCDFHVPHRLLEGYGMRDEVIESAAADGVRLIISVDTGIRAFAAAETAERAGVDLIVTDHHLVAQSEEIPKALAVLNPNQPGCGYPCKHLCGAGVAFKLAQALLERAGRARLIPSFLKVVAIATVADSVPLLDENRVIVALGLEGLRRVVNPGLKALLEVCQLGDGRGSASASNGGLSSTPNSAVNSASATVLTAALTTSQVAFRIAPRINAAGRMDVARDVVELMTVKDPVRARELAGRLDHLNAARQTEEQRISEALLGQVAESVELRDAACMVIEGEGWHRGVIGICASRVMERFGRPAVVIAVDGEEAHGSGRSIPGFHLLDALESAKELFVRFGGHAAAVGFLMRTADVPELRRRLNEYAGTRLQTEELRPVLEFDGELELEQVTPRFWEQLKTLAPFGMGNPEPVFVARGVILIGAPKVMQEKHMKLKLKRYRSGSAAVMTSGMARGVDALGWRMAHRLVAEPLAGGDAVDVLFRIEQNTRHEIGTGLQLVLADYRRTEAEPEKVVAAAIS